MDLVQLMAAHAAMVQLEEGLQGSLASEHLMATGAYQAIKWAMEYAPEDGLEEVSDKVLVDLVMRTAGPFQALVERIARPRAALPIAVAKAVAVGAGKLLVHDHVRFIAGRLLRRPRLCIP